MVKFEALPGVNYKYDYPDIFRSIKAGKIDGLSTYRELCMKDLFFLLFFGLEREDVNDPFVVKCILEVEEEHNDTLDLWAREHYKSTLITYGLPLQEIINNPNVRIGIFSHTRPIAKGFLRQIKLTLEGRVTLVKWFPDIFWNKPKTQAPKWSEDDGLIVRRSSHPKESTVEAWGLVDGQPTSKHFDVRIYDDVVTRESVTTPDQIRKVLDAYEISESLGTDGGSMRICGTHYHFADLYSHLKTQTDIYKVRMKPATDDGTASGTPVFLSLQRLADLRKKQGPYIFACQQLLNPVATEEQKFKPEWLKYYGKLPELLNRYLLCDPANEKRKDSDYTIMAVVGIDEHRNRYLVDFLRDKLNLTERWRAFRDMWIKNKPIQEVGYEKYGKDADISYFEEKQREESVYFPITPLGGQTGKTDRILRLVPWFENGQFLLPHRLYYKGEDMIKVFIDEEYVFFPFCAHDDGLDCLSRIEDMDVVPPMSAFGHVSQVAETDYDVLRH